MSAVVITKAPGYEHRRCPEQFNHGIVPSAYRSDWGTCISPDCCHLLPMPGHHRRSNFEFGEVLQIEVQTKVRASANRRSLCESTETAAYETAAIPRHVVCAR